MSATVGEYEFVSVLRRGAAADLDSADPLTGSLPARAKLDVKLSVTSSGGPGAGTDTAGPTALLLGPGDVVGIDPRQVISTNPPDLSPNFEPNFMPSIEFDHPDLPWFFTPAAAAQSPEGTKGARLRPWLCLIVLADGEFEFAADRPEEPLPAIRVASAAKLPNLDESWAWAHVQVAKGIEGERLSTLLSGEPARLLSRLICPRRLKALTHYTAFVVPTFEFGRLAGLGEKLPTGANPTTGSAWKSGDTNVLLPVYHQFEFRTSDVGDFASLVRQMEPRVLDSSVGIRPMAVDRAGLGWGIRPAGAALGLGGALRAPSTKDTNWGQISPTQKAEFQTDMRTAVNRASAPLTDPVADPRIVPPLYGRWHAARSTVATGNPGWVNELNLDPRLRALAGFGTRVVLDQRTQLLSGAWKQVDGIIEANAKLHAAQASREAMVQVHQKHFADADPDTLLSLTAPLHAKLLASPRTVRAVLADSRLPAGALSPAFRRIARRGGAVRRRQRYEPPGPGQGLLTRLNDGGLLPAPAPANPPGLVSLEQLADKLCPVPRWLRGKGWLAALLLLGLLVVLLVLGAILGFFVVSAVIAGAVLLFTLVLGSLFGPRLRDRCRAASLIGFDHLTPDGFESAPPRPGFEVATAGEPNPGVGNDKAPKPGGAPNADSLDAADFRAAAIRLGEALGGVFPDPHEAEPADLPGLATATLAGLDPQVTIPARIGAIVEVGEVLEWEPDDPLETIMAAPEFPQPMYEQLRDLSQELLLPGLDKVPANTLGLLVENHAFIEAYMVGLNHEMSRQLLFDGFPTDQRGSYFRQFWDVRSYVPTAADPADPKKRAEKLKDIAPIHHWSRTTGLGTHPNRTGIRPENLVLLLRGELLRRYPTAVVYACEAKWDAANGRHALGTEERHPQFRGTLEPDVTFMGFDLTLDEARGSTDRTKPQGWFIVFQQEPSAPRFSFEEPGAYPMPQVKEWGKLSWGHFAADAQALAGLEFAPATAQPTPVAITESPAGDPENPGDASNNWGQDAAQTAFVALSRPVRVAIHAEMMIPEDS